jgi:branched-subunit amino acid transport protein
MTVWIAIVGAGLASFGLRVAPARWAGRHELPDRWRQGLPLLGPAAFAALAAPAVALAGSGAAPTAARLVAVAVAAPVARATRSTAATLAVGMPVLWLVTAVTSG